MLYTPGQIMGPDGSMVPVYHLGILGSCQKTCQNGPLLMSLTERSHFLTQNVSTYLFCVKNAVFCPKENVWVELSHHILMIISHKFIYMKPFCQLVLLYHNTIATCATHFHGNAPDNSSTLSSTTHHNSVNLLLTKLMLSWHLLVVKITMNLPSLQI